MEKRPFLEKTAPPIATTLQYEMGAAYPFYEDLLAHTTKYRAEWNHSKQSGWMLKVHDKKKALLYVVPLKDGFRVSLTLRPQEREELLKTAELASLHVAMQAAKQYSEGFAMIFTINLKGENYAALLALIQRIMAMRS